MKSLRLTHEDLSETLGIPRRTLARRKEQAKLDPKESEAVVRLARVAVRAEDVLGDIEAALRWLRAPNRALGGRTPLSLLDTDLGAELVGDVLGRIEHGVAS
jgi:putative toxin-antitoxin system antitoxin component (TIGR02293 family)